MSISYVLAAGIGSHCHFFFATSKIRSTFRLLNPEKKDNGSVQSLFFIYANLWVRSTLYCDI